MAVHACFAFPASKQALTRSSGGQSLHRVPAKLDPPQSGSHCGATEDPGPAETGRLDTGTLSLPMSLSPPARDWWIGS